MCALRLLKQNQLFYQHWGCCGEVEYHSPCRKAEHSLQAKDVVELVLVRKKGGGDGIYRSVSRDEFWLERGRRWKLQKMGKSVWQLLDGDQVAATGRGRDWNELEWSENLFVFQLGKDPQRCAVCLQAVSAPTCQHAQQWHDDPLMCNAVCAAKLAVQLKLGKCHWGCCHVTEYDSACLKSPHQNMNDTVCVARYFPPIYRSLPYSGHDANGRAQYGIEKEKIPVDYSSFLACLASIDINDGKEQIVLNVDRVTIMDLMLLVEKVTKIAFWQQQYSTRLDPANFANKSLTLREAGVAHGSRLVVSERAEEENDAPEIRLAIIGGGPVGLWTALSLVLSNKRAEVIVFEKRAEYQRSHALRIAKMGFSGMVEQMRGLAEEFYPRTKTSVVEETLREKCLAAGVRIEQRLVEADELETLQSTFDLVICADGARSAARKRICDTEEEGEFLVDRTLGSGLLQVKFHACGKLESSGNSAWAQLMRNVDLESQLFQVLPSKYEPKDDVTPVTMFSLIDGNQETDLSHLTTKHAVSLERLHSLLGDGKSSTLCADVRRIVEGVAPNGIVADSLKISILPARYYVSSRILSQTDSILLLGDAAMGLPLEKGLGFGWRSSNHLVALLQHYGERFSIRDICIAYQSFFKELSAEAIASVEKDYQGYVGRVAQGGLARSLLRVASFGQAGNLAKKSSSMSPPPKGLCAVCRDPDVKHGSPGCLHSAPYHTSYNDCSAKCVARLGVQQIGMMHYSCCGVVEGERCPVSFHLVERQIVGKN
jgi:2-polyprenyl-6-methoxyphenol hydroxylase-like FAD-dependent oxidoreductase